MKYNTLQLVKLLSVIPLIIGNLIIALLPNQIENYPVEDGGIVQWEDSNLPLIHYSIYNIRYNHGYNDPIFNKGDFNMLKDLRYPQFPNFRDSFYINKVFNNTNNNIEVKIVSKPEIFGNKVVVEEYVKDIPNKKYFFGVEILEGIKTIKKITGSNVNIITNKCNIMIKSNGTYLDSIKIGDNIIWFESINSSIKFTNEIGC